jgi:hypothetical protein
MIWGDTLSFKEGAKAEFVEEGAPFDLHFVFSSVDSSYIFSQRSISSFVDF